jgi:DNA-binding transcriptional MerR regulator
MRGIEIAKKLAISTSALRHYEAWGIVPAVERQENGYRVYTPLHEAYFRCIREMLPGFGMDFIKKLFPIIISGNIPTALWEVNQKQVGLAQEKKLVEQTIKMLDPNVLATLPHYQHKKYFSIGEVAKEALVSTSAIRHWEKAGLLSPKRNPESHFREFDIADIRKIFIIRTIQHSVFSLANVKEILTSVENNNLTQTRELALLTLEQLEQRLRQQFKGIAALSHLLDSLDDSLL